MNNPFNQYILDRLLFNRKIDTIKGCWLWIGGITGSGYGAITYKHGGKTYSVHRLIAYICLGLDLDSNIEVLHKCDNPKCFNPTHLFLGSHAENMWDRDNKKRNGQANKTHCPSGHPYSGNNLYIDGRGYRRCIICRDISYKEYKERNSKSMSP